MRLFATGMMERVMSAAFPDDVPIESKMVTKAVERAQTTVEQRNAEIRKNVLKYDEVMNEQRKVVYAKRNQILDAANLRDALHALTAASDAAGLRVALRILKDAVDIADLRHDAMLRLREAISAADLRAGTLEGLQQARDDLLPALAEAVAAANLREDALQSLAEAVDGAIEASCTSTVPDEWDLPGLLTEIGTYYPTRLGVDDLADLTHSDEVYDRIMGEGTAYYEQRERELGDEAMRELERMIMLNVLDQHWREHLYEMDYLREGIGLRAMGQRDPLTEWQREGYDMFAQMMRSVAEDFVRIVMRTEVRQQLSAEPVRAVAPAGRTSADAQPGAGAGAAPEAEGAPVAADRRPTGQPAAARAGSRAARARPAGVGSSGVTNVSYTSSEGARPAAGATGGGGGAPPRQAAAGRGTQVAATGPSRVTAAGPKSRAQRTAEALGGGAPDRPANQGQAARPEDKVGRNEPCPCGSGRKFKLCHGRTPAGSATA